ncbi:hypothetical protein [Arthrobacter sp. HLT1-20]
MNSSKNTRLRRGAAIVALAAMVAAFAAIAAISLVVGLVAKSKAARTSM